MLNAPNEKRWDLNIPISKAEQAAMMFKAHFPEYSEELTVVPSGIPPTFEGVKVIFTCPDIPDPQDILAFIAEVETTLNG